MVSVAEEKLASVRFWPEKLQPVIVALQADVVQIVKLVAGGAIELRGRQVRLAKRGPDHGGPREVGVEQRGGREVGPGQVGIASVANIGSRERFWPEKFQPVMLLVCKSMFCKS